MQEARRLNSVLGIHGGALLLLGHVAHDGAHFGEDLFREHGQ